MLYADGTTNNIDSLTKLVNVQTGQERISTLIHLSETYREISMEKSFETGTEAEKYANKEGLNSMKGTILLSLGKSATISGDYQLAQEYLKKAVTAFEETKNYSELAKTLMNIGLAYKKTAEYEKADKYFLSAIELSKQHKLIDQLAGAEVNRATMFFTIGEFDKAMDSYQKVLPIYLELKDTLRYAKVVMNIGLIYWNWNKNDLALEKQLEAKSLLEKKKDFVELARVNNNIGRLYYQDLKDTTKALEYYEKSLEIRQNIGSQDGMAVVLSNIGNIYSDKKQFKTAFEYYNKALALSETIGFKEGTAMATYYMGISHQKNKNYTESNRFLDACLKISKEYGITTYYSLVNEYKMNNYAALGDFDAFIAEARIFKTERDTLKVKLDELKYKELIARNKINEISPELELANEKIADQQQALVIHKLIIAILLAGLVGFGYVHFFRSRKK
jgi:tetratricopeptide (TPR) repeat protein